MATTLENLKAFLEFLNRLKDWDEKLRYDLSRAGEDQDWGFIALLRQMASYPFPPKYEVLFHTETDLADGGKETDELTAENWGEGKNFYIATISIGFLSANEFNTTHEDAIDIILERKTLDQVCFAQTFKNSPYKQTAPAKWRFKQTIPLVFPVRIASDDILKSTIQNESGQTVSIGVGLIYFTEEI